MQESIRESILSGRHQYHYVYQTVIMNILISRGADLNHLIETQNGRIVNPIISELTSFGYFAQGDISFYDLCLRLIHNELILSFDKEYPHIVHVLNNPYMNNDDKFRWVYLLLSYCYDPNLKNINSIDKNSPLTIAKNLNLIKIEKLLELYRCNIQHAETKRKTLP